eukprot:4975228-Amphidinium_carterae.1
MAIAPLNYHKRRRPCPVARRWLLGRPPSKLCSSQLAAKCEPKLRDCDAPSPLQSRLQCSHGQQESSAHL